jgi:hypothetical protein
MPSAAKMLITEAETVAPREAHHPLAECRRALRLGKDILGLLEDLHASVRAAAADEPIPAADLDDLAEAEASLKTVLGEIQLRAHCELAKLDQSRH